MLIMVHILRKGRSFQRFTGDLENYKKQFMCRQPDKHYLVRTGKTMDKPNSFTRTTCGCCSLSHKGIEIVHYTLPMLTKSQIRDKRLIALSKNLCKFSTAVKPLNRLIQVHLLFNFLNKCANSNKNIYLKKLIKEYDLIFNRCIQNENRSPHHQIPICKNYTMYLKM